MISIAKNWLIYVGMLMVCVSVFMVGCKELATNTPEYPTQTNTQTGLTEPVPWEQLSSNAKTAYTAAALANAGKAAQPIADIAAPVTGGLSSVVTLLATNILTAIYAVLKQRESSEQRQAITDIHNSQPSGAVALATKPASKKTLGKITGDT